MAGLSGNAASIADYFQSYADSLPNAMWDNVLSSFAVGAACGILMSNGNLTAGCVSGVAAALSSLIYTAVSPIFAKFATMSGTYPTMSRFQHICRVILSITTAAALLSLVIPYRMDIVVSTVTTVALNLIRDNRANYPVYHSICFG